MSGVVQCLWVKAPVSLSFAVVLQMVMLPSELDLGRALLDAPKDENDSCRGCVGQRQEY